MTALGDHLKRLIRQNGPISIATFMAEALAHAEHGYYTSRDPLGAKGDFVTAPEVSQIFGELIGVWLIDAWERQGAPEKIILCELGPGRGTLMADILRAGRVRPNFLNAAQVHFVEVSPALRARQEAALGGSHKATWHTTLTSVPSDRLSFFVANEFFDALPIRQFIRGESKWHERNIGLDNDRLIFGVTRDGVPEELVPPSLRQAPTGSLVETRTAADAIVSDIAARLTSGGAALLIDYGYERHAVGDTFQAMKAHAFTDPLLEPGEADLTAHVDFEALAAAAQNAGTSVFGPATQAGFLTALGINLRAERLAAANPTKADAIQKDVERLTSPLQMGSLFKVLALLPQGAQRPPGF